MLLCRWPSPHARNRRRSRLESRQSHKTTSDLNSCFHPFVFIPDFERVPAVLASLRAYNTRRRLICSGNQSFYIRKLERIFCCLRTAYQNLHRLASELSGSFFSCHAI